MTTQEILQALELATNSAAAIAKLIAELRAQSGMSDDQLLAWAEEKDAETRDLIHEHLGLAR